MAATGNGRICAMAGRSAWTREEAAMGAQAYVYAGVAGYVGRPNAEGKVGVFRRPVAGGAWEHVLSELEAHAVFVHPSDPNLVFAGTVDGVWRSTDRGAAFRRAQFPDVGKQIWSFLADAGGP